MALPLRIPDASFARSRKVRGFRAGRVLAPYFLQVRGRQAVQELKPGDLVRVRRARWRVVDTRPYDVCQIITLSGADPAGAGVERRVIAPFDVVERIARPAGVRLVHSRRWRCACRELLAANAPPGALRSARHARMDLLPHQLAPALAILRGLGSRVLLADDVGL